MEGSWPVNGFQPEAYPLFQVGEESIGSVWVSEVPTSIAWPLLENLVENFSVISLGQKDYLNALEESSRNGVERGRIYDMLLLAAAAKAGVDRIYTFNVSHFQELASEELKKRIVAP